MHPAVGVAVLLLVCCLDTVRADLEHSECDPKKSCGGDWYYIDDDRCGLHVEDLQTFSEAEDYCKEQGGELLSVHDNEELFGANCLAFDNTNTETGVWIGGENSEGEFKWTDGTLFDYSFWDDNQPSGTGCIEVNFEDIGQWSVEDCSEKNFFMCAKKP
ncbi:C-type isolectin Sp-CL4-like [Antennarius striatus]|uniref:C-type isolectin Sp-CL4-like n=1 Tax=Antennarius striatus TaxID=241820 RepID=UPI0035B08089